MAKSEANRRKVERLPERTVRQVVGKRVQALRLERGWPQIQVAQGMTIVGLEKWRSMTVASLEHGQREVSLDELLALAEVFGVPLADLVLDPANPDDEPSTWALRLGPQAFMPPAVARWYLTAGRKGPLGWRPPKDGIFATNSPSSGDHLMKRDDANAKVARSLGITVDQLLALSSGLWGMTPARRRDLQLAQMRGADHLTLRSRQARRGHVTRTLLAELRSAIARLPRPIAEYGESDFDELRADLGFPMPPKVTKKDGTP
jgi:transcriptional regulator with XRE-family HTH domain